VTECIHVNLCAAVLLLRLTDIDAFYAPQFSPAQLAIVSKGPQQGKMRTSKNIEQP